MRPFFALVGVAPLLAGCPLLVGCGAVAAAKSVRTYAAPVASAPPAGSIRIVPQKPVVTRTTALYEWQVVCDKTYSSTSSTNAETTISGGSPVNRLKGQLPTVFTYFVEVETKPHGDGSMGLTITEGQRSAETRPLLEPSARPTRGGGGYGATASDGHKEAPAGSFVRRLAVAPTDVKVPGSIDLARIEFPPPAFANLRATKYEGGKERVGYEKNVPLDAKGELPASAYNAPKLAALQKQGYQIVGYGMAMPKRTETARLIFKP